MGLQGCRLRVWVAALAVPVASTSLTGSAQAVDAPASLCPGVQSGQLPPAVPGTLRYGISPRVEVGQTGAVGAAAVPAVPSEQVTALRRLAGSRQFVVRLTRNFWPEPAGQQTRLDSDVSAYSSAGFVIELQLRYHPALRPDDPHNPPEFAAWAASIAHRYDSSGHMVSIQVTNEVNFRASPDSSDGFYPGAQDALIDGVEAVKRQLDTDRAQGVKVGFNWFYRSPDDGQFWSYLSIHGSPEFVRALDWVGLDAYPGTFFFPVEPGNGLHDGMVNALSALRCFSDSAGIPASIPIYVEETGFPTEGQVRSPERQAEAVRQLSAAAREYAGNYGVSDFRWFDLRDADSSSPNPQQHYGLLYSSYAEKPAFCAYRLVVSGLGCGAVAASHAVSQPVPNLPATGAPAR